MANLAASDITVTVQQVRLMGRQRRVQATLTFGDGAKLYPVGGIPMPAGSKFGFYRQVDIVDLADFAFSISNADWTWASDASVTNTYAQPGTLKAFMAAVLGGTAGTVATGISSDADGATMSKTAANTRSNLISYVECTNTFAPAATVLRAELIGW